ncbi:hypothetical protein TWF730_003838 [Orbilia blumenaviensis]|uniref:Uncharacterized protein n=1 Tax=Orbilia blumenaviensis TaxID=1796055 RepID=A0AAV9U1P2_9PEZI
MQEIIVSWSRRRADSPKTFTRRWKWTREDRARIEFYRTELAGCISSATFDAMLEGVNSESLLPFIFCYTVRLKDLDLGFVEAGLVARSWFCLGEGFENLRRVLGPGPRDEGFKYIEDEVEGEDTGYNDPDTEPDDIYVQEQFLTKQMPAGAEEEGALWFNVNIGAPGNYLPGLRGVIRLQSRSTIYQFPLTALSGWSAKYIAPLLFLPNLQELEVEGHATIGGLKDQFYYPLSIPLQLYKGLKSKVKRLSLVDGRMRVDDYDALAELTGNLEYLQIYHTYRYEELSPQEYASIASFFRKNNRSTLSLEEICINDIPGTDMVDVN